MKWFLSGWLRVIWLLVKLHRESPSPQASVEFLTQHIWIQEHRRIVQTHTHTHAHTRAQTTHCAVPPSLLRVLHPPNRFALHSVFCALAQGGTLATDFQFVFNTLHDYSPRHWLSALTAVCLCVLVWVCVGCLRTSTCGKERKFLGFLGGFCPLASCVNTKEKCLSEHR